MTNPPSHRSHAAPQRARSFCIPLGPRDYLRPAVTRSRYSGAPLEHDHMVITLAAQCAEAFWHASVVFEWADAAPQRRHELFHFAPASPPAGNAGHAASNHDAYYGVPGHVAHSSHAPDTLPQRDRDQQRIPAVFRSWDVSWGQANAALERALAFVHAPPAYFLTAYNCADFAHDIAQTAGIDARSWLGAMISIPRWDSASGLPLDGSEAEMWSDRRARDTFVRDQLELLPRSDLRLRLIDDVQQHRVSLDDARRRYKTLEAAGFPDGPDGVTRRTTA